MDVTHFVNATQDAIHVRRVYAEPYEKDGATVIVAARIGGGAGGGTGTLENGEPSEGGGYGVGAAPSGAFVIRDGDVKWIPAINPLHLAATVGAVVAVVAVARSWQHVRIAKYSRS